MILRPSVPEPDFIEWLCRDETPDNSVLEDISKTKMASIIGRLCHLKFFPLRASPRAGVAMDHSPFHRKSSICAATSLSSENAAFGNGAMRRMIFALSTPAMPRTD